MSDYASIANDKIFNTFFMSDYTSIANDNIIYTVACDTNMIVSWDSFRLCLNMIQRQSVQK